MPAGPGSGEKVIQAVTYSACSAGRLYAAMLRTIGEIGFIVTARDDPATSVQFRPATPTGSWPYEHMSAVILPDGSGARIVFSAAAVGAGWMQMGQWRQGHATTTMVLDRLKTVLPQVPEPAA